MPQHIRGILRVFSLHFQLDQLRGATTFRAETNEMLARMVTSVRFRCSSDCSFHPSMLFGAPESWSSFVDTYDS